MKTLKEINEVHPDEMDQACALAEGTLSAYRKNNVPPETIALSLLVNLTGVCIAELSMDEETFVTRCREQFCLYRQFQSDQFDAKVGKVTKQ